MAKKYYWLKLKEDFFTAKEIKKLRHIAGGDTYTVIYLKMMLMSLRDEGRLFFDGIEESFSDELALVLDEDPENVKVTIMYLQKMGLLEVVNETEAFLTQVPETIGKETDKAEIMRRIRANGNNVTNVLPDRYQSVTQRKRKDIDIEIDIEKEIEKSKNKRFAPPTIDKVKEYISEKGYAVNAEAFISYYESVGWKVGKNPMKDWKAAVRTWAQRDRKNEIDWDAMAREAEERWKNDGI